MKRLTILFYVMTMSVIAFAQNFGEINGKVIDADSKEPIPYAYLQLFSGTTTVMEAESDINGSYTLKPLNPGTYTLEVNYIGYGKGVFTNIHVEPRGLTYLDCAISSSSLMDTLVVHPPLVDADDPEIKTTFGEDMIGHMPVSSPVEVAIQAPKVQPNERSGGLFLGGSREDATLYVVDGVKVIGSVYVPMNAVKSISVLTDGIPAQYGDVTGGIIEITTKGYTGIY